MDSDLAVLESIRQHLLGDPETTGSFSDMSFDNTQVVSNVVLEPIRQYLLGDSETTRSSFSVMSFDNAQVVSNVVLSESWAEPVRVTPKRHHSSKLPSSSSSDNSSPKSKKRKSGGGSVQAESSCGSSPIEMSMVNDQSVAWWTFDHLTNDITNPFFTFDQQTNCNE
ncbi:hypothetical protein FH972_011078 [Carpinus fangiana]|uniref:Uncharacterized protein n=1 Tax=Carpinus fangiana TaxID=176857 RepID=A0A660KS22_9ROSI|nr:hypothetical protein FH972_011078 [Carpinus fangiana]